MAVWRTWHSSMVTTSCPSLLARGLLKNDASRKSRGGLQLGKSILHMCESSELLVSKGPCTVARHFSRLLQGPASQAYVAMLSTWSSGEGNSVALPPGCACGRQSAVDQNLRMGGGYMHQTPLGTPQPQGREWHTGGLS
jgi:hypothetical protein